MTRPADGSAQPSGAGLREESQIIGGWRADEGAPVVSVLCHVYNQRPYVEAALMGILGQVTDFPIEVIVRDDASTDGTRQVVTSYAARYPRILRPLLEAENRYRQGVKPTTVTVSQARGEFIAFCEGDDFWTDPLKLQKQVDLLRVHPELGAVHSEFSHLVRRAGGWRSLGRHNRDTGRHVPDGQVFEALLQGNFIQTCTFCARTGLARDYLSAGFPIATYPVGDWPLFLYVANRSGIAYLPEPTATYRRVPESAMNTDHRGRLRTMQGYVTMIEDFCSRFAVTEAIRWQALRRYRRALLSLSLLAGDREAFRAAWEWLDAHDPEFLYPLRRRAMPWLVQVPLACRALAFIDDARVAMRQLRGYQPINSIHARVVLH